MKKYNLSAIMKMAHGFAKQLIGDYAARIAAGLRKAWEEVKKMAEKVVTPFIDAEPVTVDGYYYPALSGTSSAWTKSGFDAEFENGVLYVDYASDVEYGDRTPKRTEVKITVKHGFINNNVVNIDLSSESIKEIQGRTYEIKSIIKEFGFKWNKETKSWVR